MFLGFIDLAYDIQNDVFKKKEFATYMGIFIILLMLTVKRIPLGLEKLYARAVLTFLLVMGLNVGQLYQKHFWVFLAFVMASERTAEFFATATDELVPYVEYEEELLPQYQMV